jgi:hypothetical protein
MTITIQIGETGNVPIPEHNAQLKQLLKSFAEKEVTISISELTPFQVLLDNATDLQNRFTKMMRGEKWTTESITLIRGEISSAYYYLSDPFAEAKSDEKNALANASYILDKLKIELMKNGDSPTLATAQSKISAAYVEAQNDYLQYYKIRTMIEQLMRSLDATMNAISGLQKIDPNKLKF